MNGSIKSAAIIERVNGTNAIIHYPVKFIEVWGGIIIGFYLSTSNLSYHQEIFHWMSCYFVEALIH